VQNFGIPISPERLKRFRQNNIIYSTSRIDELVRLLRSRGHGQGRSKVIYLSELLRWAEVSTSTRQSIIVLYIFSRILTVLSCALRRSAYSKCPTPLHGHRLRTRCTTPPTDKLTTTILQLVVQQICHIAMPEPNISTCQDVGMWQSVVRW